MHAWMDEQVDVCMHGWMDGWSETGKTQEVQWEGRTKQGMDGYNIVPVHGSAMVLTSGPRFLHPMPA